MLPRRRRRETWRRIRVPTQQRGDIDGPRVADRCRRRAPRRARRHARRGEEERADLHLAGALPIDASATRRTLPDDRKYTSVSVTPRIALRAQAGFASAPQTVLPRDTCLPSERWTMSLPTRT